MRVGRWRRNLGLAALLLAGQDCSQDQHRIDVLCSTGLAPAVREIADRFEQNNPAARVELTVLPDLDAISQLRVGVGSIDLVAIADPALVEHFLDLQLGAEYSLLAGDEVVLATGRSDIWSTSREVAEWNLNWLSLIFDSNLSFASADPDRDSLGYFTKLSWKLAEIHYDRQGLYRRFLLHLATAERRLEGLRLVQELESGRIDLAFIFLSTALQRNLNHLRLPPEVSLGSAAHSDLYSRVFEQISGPEGEIALEISASPIRYAVALLEPEDAWARRFQDFLFSRESKSLLRAMGYRDVPLEVVRSKRSRSQ